MPTIPDPTTLLELALSAQQHIEDREWKQYQRYLAKFKHGGGDDCDQEPLSFKDFCAWLRGKENNTPGTKKSQ